MKKHFRKTNFLASGSPCTPEVPNHLSISVEDPRTIKPTLFPDICQKISDFLRQKNNPS